MGLPENFQTRPYAFVVPPELEAHEPPEVRGASRDDVRLLVTDSIRGARHFRFDELPEVLTAGDLVVLNDSKTYPAALSAIRKTGQSLLLHFANFDHAESAHSPRATGWTKLVLSEPRKATPAPVPGEEVLLPGGGRATFISRHRGSQRMWITEIALPLPYFEYFERYGKPVAYPHLVHEFPIQTFQTAYARTMGSSEMPSAGRPFTPAILDRLVSRRIEIAAVTLHAGLSSVERDELPLEEWRDVSAESAAAVRRAIKRGSRVVAVGTTVVRALEGSLDTMFRAVPTRGWTGLHIRGDRSMRVVSGLLTGFHEPTSTHLAILESLAGQAHIRNAYDVALAERYVWHEFGDSHLILSRRG